MNQLRNSNIESEHSSPKKNGSLEMKNLKPHSIKVFKDLHFSLTYTSFQRLPTTNDNNQCSDNESSSSDLGNVRPDSYKIHLRDAIRKHGGTVYDYVNLIPECYYKCSYIITDSPAQTCNFILGLTLGIPAYHHKYIRQAVFQEKPFPEFLTDNNIQPIPNGWCIETGNIIFRSPETDHKNLFSGYIIYLSLGDEDRTEYFEGILRYCGAIVYTSWRNGVCLPFSGYTTIIITDENCPPRLARTRVPKLSLYWLIQCLITESVRPKDGHEIYTAHTMYDEEE